MPRVTTYSDLRQNLARHMDAVVADREPLVVTRQKGPAVVMLAQAEYDSLMETLHLLRSPANAARLLQAMAETEAGRVEHHDLIEPEDAEPEPAR